jgi:hypothetical protein
MDPREQAMLEEALRLSRENNEYLRKLYRGYRWSWLFRTAYWIVIIGVAIGAFYFIQPIIERFFDAAQQLNDGFTSSRDAVRSFRDFVN